jgi:ribosome-associated protein
MKRPKPEPAAEDVPIHDEVIRLGQFLKLANLVDSGSDAKMAIAEGEVLVDGAVETRRGRQLHDGAVVEYAGRRARVVHGSEEIDVPW